MKNYVIINTKSTGLLNPFDNTTLIKLEAVKLDLNFNEQAKFFEYIKPSEELSKEVEDFTKITNTMLKEQGISLKEALEKFLEFIKNCWIISYNANFDISLITKGIYETGIEDHEINFISLKEYFKYKTKLCKKIKSCKLENIAKYYDIKYNNLNSDWLMVVTKLLKKVMEEEQALTIDEFIDKPIPKILLPGLSKKDTKVKVRFHNGKGLSNVRSIEFIDKTKNRKVSYLTSYNAINRYDTTFYELILFRKWNAITIDDFIYMDLDTIDYFDYYSIYSSRDLSTDLELRDKILEKIPYLDKYNIKLGCLGSIDEIKKNYKVLGEDNLTKLIDHIKIFGKEKVKED